MSDMPDHIDTLSAAERRALLANLLRRKTSAGFVHRLIEEQAERTPDAVAMIASGQQLTYAELRSRAVRLAGQLQALGVGPELLVGVYLDDPLDLVVALLGTLIAGGCYLPLDPSSEHAATHLTASQAPVVVTRRSSGYALPQHGGRVLDLDADAPALEARLADFAGKITAESCACTLYRDQRAAVDLAHRAVATAVQSLRQQLALTSQDRLLVARSAVLGRSGLELFVPLVVGAALIVADDDLVRGTATQATAIYARSDTWRRLLAVGWQGAPELKILSGGPALPSRLAAQLRAGALGVWQGYGYDEITEWAAIRELDDASVAAIGRPAAGAQLYVLDARLRQVPIGVTGELYVGGAILARGYHGQSVLTAQRFLPHSLSDDPGARVFRTGDLARYRQDGTLEYMGRSHWAASSADPDRVAAVLEQHPAVQEAIVRVRVMPDEPSVNQLVAYIVPLPGLAPTIAELRRSVQAALPAQMIPAHFALLPMLPLTTSGAIDEQALLATPSDDDQTTFVAPSTSTEQRLASIWSEVLGVPLVGIHDNFFALGGDSIRSLQIHAQAQRAGLAFPIQYLFQHRTIAELAQAIDTSEDVVAAPPSIAPFELVTPDVRGSLPADVEDAYPLARLQAGMLFQRALSGHASMYHDLFSYHVTLPLDADTFQQAAQYVAARHPALRTSFDLESYDEPLQLVHRGVRVPLEVSDLRAYPPTTQESMLAAFRAAEKHSDFPASVAPRLRLFVHRRSDESLQLTLSVDHAILDGWSMAALLTELVNAYLRLYEGGPEADAPPVAAQYRDFIALERAAERSEQHRQFWERQLADALACELPRWPQPEPDAQHEPIGVLNLLIPEPVLDGLNRLAQSAGVQLKSVLLAAHLKILSVLSGQSDVLTGLVANGRPETEGSERVLGLFLNTLPLRVQLRGGTWLDLVQQTFAAERELLPFRHYPLASLQRGRDRQPLFSAVFDFVNFHIYQGLHPRVQVLGIDLFEQTEIPLYVRFWSDGRSPDLTLSLSYDRAVLTDAQMALVRGYYDTILRAIVAAPHAPVETVDLLSPGERRLLAELNATGQDYPADRGVHALVAEQAASTPDAIAVVCDDSSLTYRELDRRADQLARHLRALGVTLETPVAICMERSPELLIGLLGILKAGGAYVPLDPSYPRERLALMLEDAQVPVVVTQRHIHSLLPEHTAQVVAVEDVLADDGPTPVDQVDITKDAIAYIIYTSGSTGRPKGVQVPHRALTNLLIALRRQLAFTEHDTLLALTTLSFDIAALELFLPLISGGHVVIVGRAAAADGAQLLDRIAACRPTFMQATPATWRLLQAAGWQPRRSMTMLCGGEALPQDLADWLTAGGGSLWNLYGPTETTIWSMAQAITGGEAVLIGRPIANTQIYLLDDALHPVPIGTPGMLYIGGDGVARGYMRSPDRTAEAFLPDPFADDNLPGRRLYRTGDLARALPDGRLEYLGRKDSQIKLRGFRIEVGEIEQTLMQHPAVAEAVVVVRQVGQDDRRLVAYIVEKEPRTQNLEPRTGEHRNKAQKKSDDSPDSCSLFSVLCSSQELRQFLAERLPAYMIPSAFVVLDALPLTPNRKVDRSALPAPKADSVAGGDVFVAPRTPTEELLVGIYADLLGSERVDIHSDFFDLGGHSLLAAQLVSRLRAALDVELPLSRLFEAPTVAALAQSIDALHRTSGSSAAPPLMPAPNAAEAPLSFSQQRLWFLDQMEPGNPVYNIPAAALLTGPLDVAALRRSLSALVSRHTILQAVFPAADGQPVQIQGQHSLTLTILDLQSLDADAQEREVARLSAEESRRSFDLERGPLARVSLLRLAVERHVILVTMHHIVSDGWSIDLFIHELTTHYLIATGAATDEQAAQLRPLPVQYSDFASWQRQWLRPEVVENQLAYWRQQLQGTPTGSGTSSLPVIDLPSDRPRPAVQTYNGARQYLEIPAALVAALKALSRREGATLFMTLLAGFKLLLHRYTGQDDLLVGTPIANRSRPEIEPLIGFFGNMLVLRTDLSGDPSFGELIRRERAAALAAYMHADLPFEKLVEELHVERDLSRTPLFQVMFGLQTPMVQALDLPGLTWQPLPVDSGTSKFDLTLDLSERAERVGGWFEYNTDLFDAATIERMSGHFLTLLADVAANPAQRVSQVRLLTDAEYDLLVAVNNTAADYSQSACIHGLFEEQAARTPGAVAAIFEDEQLSYRELNRRANQLAHHLRGLGVGPGVAVGICVERSLEMLIGLLGILKAGGAYVPLDPSYPQERLAWILTDSQAPVIVTQQRLVAGLPQHQARLVRLDRDQAEIAAAPQDEPRSGVTAENLAYIIYTSGSTGKPKGVMITHRNVVNFFAGMDERLGGEQPGIWLAVTSISFDISVLELFWTLARGYTLVIQEEQAPTLHRPALRHADQPIDFSLFYFASADQPNGANPYKLLLEGAKFADRHGFKAVWTPERHFHAFGGLYPNPSVTAAAIATITERIQIRAGSVVLPLHSPIRVAEEWAVVDTLSQGRVGISFASGWHADDFVFAPDSYANRRESMYEGIETVRRLWRGESLPFRGGSGNEVAISILPRPVQPELPFWVTAAESVATFRSAGQIGANLLTHLLGQSVEELADKIAAYREAWREHGHGPGMGHVTLMLHTFVGDDLEVVREQVRGPMIGYLRSNLSLLKNLARSIGSDIDAASFSEADMDALLEYAFERYAAESSLLGTPETCLALIDRLKGIGVDEVACLIDFGMDVDLALAGLQRLDQVRERSNLSTEVVADFSIAAQIERYAVTHLQCTPSMARMLTLLPEAFAALRGLHTIMLGGEALPVPLAQQLKQSLPADLHNMYGPTETTIWSATHLVEHSQGAVPIGRPIANTRIAILDRYLQPMPVGVPGELYIGGDGVARGYLHRPDLTAERFIPDPFGQMAQDGFGARLYRTGDLAKYRPDGTIDFLGRVDHQVKIRGHRIELGEIEAVLSLHPSVREVAVVDREDLPGDQRLVAYLVPVQPLTNGFSLQLPPEQVEEVLAQRQRAVLPNGLLVAQLSNFQTMAIYREIFEDHIYFKHGVTLNQGDCVFDVGANIGLFTLYVHQRQKNLRVFAFEPIRPTFETLRANVLLYGLDVQLHNCGVAHRSGRDTFSFYPHAPGLSGRAAVEEEKQATRSIVLNWLQQNSPDRARELLSEAQLDQMLDEYMHSEAFECEITTISDLIREHDVARIDLLKLDAERSELDVLMGIRAEDWPKIKQIVIEIHTKELLDQIAELLTEHGYTFSVDEFIAVEENVDYVYMLYARQEALVAVGTHDDRSLHEEAPAWSLEALQQFLAAQLPDYMLPSAYVTLPALPLTPNGKIDRRALPAPTAGGMAGGRPSTPPQTPTEQTLAALWTEVLGEGSWGIEDNFFDRGGHSLMATQLVARIRATFDIDLTLQSIFTTPTIKGLAEIVDAAVRTRGPAAQPTNGQPAARTAAAIVPRSEPGAAPLSFAQQRLWFLEQLQPGTSAYNFTTAFRISGPLHVAVLRQSLNEVVRRHSILRTTFPVIDGRPAQVIAAPQNVPLAVVDLRGSAEQEHQVQALIDQAARRCFDLVDGPLLSVALIQLDLAKHVLLISMHYLLTDSWSIGILLREIITLYEAFRAGTAASAALPPLPIQYADFAAWEQQQAGDDLIARQLAYWRGQLANVPVLALPTDRQPPSAPTLAGAAQRIALSTTLTDALDELSRREGVTLFMTLLASLSVLLHYVTGQRDIVVGTDVANRKVETEPLIGFFVNQLVLRTDLSGDPAFGELLRRVRDVTLAAYANQDLPFQKLVEALQPDRRQHASPLFRVKLILQNVPMPTAEVAGLSLKPIEVENNSAQFDLIVNLMETADGLVGGWEYRTELFDAATITRLIEHFQTLLHTVTSSPETNLAALRRLLAEADERKKRSTEAELEQTSLRKLKQFTRRSPSRDSE